MTRAIGSERGVRLTSNARDGEGGVGLLARDARARRSYPLKGAGVRRGKKGRRQRRRRG